MNKMNLFLWGAVQSKWSLNGCRISGNATLNEQSDKLRLFISDGNAFLKKLNISRRN